MNAIMNLQLFADAGTLVNTSVNYVNAGTGATTNFDGTNTLAGELKTFYDTELLENARQEMYYAQFAKRQPLPANHGKTVEWRKWNTFAKASQLQEGVIPTGQKFGMSSKTTRTLPMQLFPMCWSCGPMMMLSWGPRRKWALLWRKPRKP